MDITQQGDAMANMIYAMNKNYCIRETENIKVVSLNDQYNVYYDGKVHTFDFIVDAEDYLLQM